MVFIRISLFLFLLLPQMAFAQYLSWQSKFSPNNVNDLVWFDGEWYAGTKSGLFHFSPDSPAAGLTLAKEDGLSSVYITALAADTARNQLIIGYQNGDLQFYSPETGLFTTLADIRINKNFTNKQINRLIIQKNLLWIATEFGVVIYNLSAGFFEVDFSRVDDQTDIKVYDIDFFSGRIWLATSQGIYSANENEGNLKNPAVWSPLSGVPNGAGSALLKSGSDLYIGLISGLYRFNGTTVESLSGWTTNSVIDLAAGPSDSLFILTNKSGTSEWKILKFNPAGTLQNSFPVETGSRLAISPNGVVCGSPTAGIYNATTSVPFTLPGMPFNSLFDLAFDGSSFVGSSGKGNAGFMVKDESGEFYVNRAKYPEIPLVDGFYGATFYEGKVLVGTWGAGIVEVTQDRAVSLINNKNSGLKGILTNFDFVVIPDVDVDQNGDLWMTNYVPTDGKGLKVKRKGKSWNELDGFSYPGNPGYLFKKHWIDPVGNHWLEVLDNDGGATIGLLVYSENGTTNTSTDDKYVLLNNKAGTGNLPSPAINDIAFDGSGAAWIATPSGLSVLYNSNYIISQTGSINANQVLSIQNESVQAVFVDVSGRKWVALSSGIAVLSAQSENIEEFYSVSNSGLMSDAVSRLRYNEVTGEIFAMTDFGLSVFKSPKVHPASNPETPFVYPNPFLPEQHHTLWLKGLSKNSEVLIMNMAGRVIRKLEPVSGFVNTWDGRDQDGNWVSSGIYVISYRDQDKDKATTGKVAVIR